MRIDRVTVADWERGAEQISPQHDYILRVLALSWMVTKKLITPEHMSEVLGANFTAVRRLPPKKRTSLDLAGAAMMQAMAPHPDSRAVA
jgi:predicted component of type VI protein secretion system